MSSGQEMDKALFCVGKRPFAVWGGDIAEKNVQFLNTYDVRQFEYLATVHLAQLDQDGAQQAATALRIDYGLAQEALLSLIGATLQAPHCVFAWLSEYGTPDIELVVRGIEGLQNIPHFLSGPLSWETLSAEIHRGLILSNKAEGKEIKAKYAMFWSYLANEFMDKKIRNEYNGAKHGLRFQPGGFRFGLGRQLTQNEPVPLEKLDWTPPCPYGATTMSLAKIGFGKEFIDYRIKEETRNWDPLCFAGRLELISMSINNIIYYLRVINGQDKTPQQYYWPADLELFERAWNPDYQIISLGREERIQQRTISPTNKQEVLDKYRYRS
jgi:hypothetical protein